MNTETHSEQTPRIARMKRLLNNPVSDSWQLRNALSLGSGAEETSHEQALDLVGYSLNGRPLYRAWQLALILGISPALLSTSLGAIPSNLRPFELCEEEYESQVGQAELKPCVLAQKAPFRAVSSEKERLLALRRLTVLARSAEGSVLGEWKGKRWDALIAAFTEF